MFQSFKSNTFLYSVKLKLHLIRPLLVKGSIRRIKPRLLPSTYPKCIKMCDSSLTFTFSGRIFVVSAAEKQLHSGGFVEILQVCGYQSNRGPLWAEVSTNSSKTRSFKIERMCDPPRRFNRLYLKSKQSNYSTWIEKIRWETKGTNRSLQKQS